MSSKLHTSGACILSSPTITHKHIVSAEHSVSAGVKDFRICREAITHKHSMSTRVKDFRTCRAQRERRSERLQNLQKSHHTHKHTVSAGVKDYRKATTHKHSVSADVKDFRICRAQRERRSEGFQNLQGSHHPQAQRKRSSEGLQNLQKNSVGAGVKDFKICRKAITHKHSVSAGVKGLRPKFLAAACKECQVQHHNNLPAR
eukprot:489333-Pelagomonas_calceolata.AAC.3